MEQKDTQGFKKDQSQNRSELARKAKKVLDDFEHTALFSVPAYLSISTNSEKRALRRSKEEYDRSFGSPEEALERILFIAELPGVKEYLAETNRDINVGGVRIAAERYRYSAGVSWGGSFGSRLQSYPEGEGYRLTDSLDYLTGHHPGGRQWRNKEEIVAHRVQKLTASQKRELANLSRKKVIQIFRSAINENSRRK